MWTTSVSRNDFPELVKGAKGLRQRATYVSDWQSFFERDQAALVWSDDSPTDIAVLPQVIVASPEVANDLFAWLGTYAPSYRPLTAFAHVIDHDVARQIDPKHTPSLGALEGACVATILCEVLPHANGDEVFGTALESCGFVIARALSVGYAGVLKDRLRNFWYILHGQPVPPHCEEVWSVITHLTKNSSSSWLPGMYTVGDTTPTARIVEYVSLLRDGRTIPDDVLLQSIAVDQRQHLPESLGLMEGPREQRVAAFEHVSGSLMQGDSRTIMSRAFVLGYLASRIAPGTLEHLSLLRALENRLPGVMLWYGLCAGLSGGTELVQRLGSVGNRILRELRRRESLFDPPRCDVAISELTVLKRSSEPTAISGLASAGRLIVELLPGVNATVRIGKRAATEVQPVDVQELQATVAELRHALNRSQQLQSKLERLLARRESEESRPKRSRR